MKLDVKAGMRLLLVENEAPLKRSLENFLKRNSYTFTSCCTARDALKVAESFHPDVVIIEYRLPDASGTSLIRQLERVCPDVVAVLISEYDFDSIANEVNQARVHYFLKKPFDPAEFEMALYSSCSKAQVAVANLQWKESLDVEGMSASILEWVLLPCAGYK